MDKLPFKEYSKDKYELAYIVIDHRNPIHKEVFYSFNCFWNIREFIDEAILNIKFEDKDSYSLSESIQILCNYTNYICEMFRLLNYTYDLSEALKNKFLYGGKIYKCFLNKNTIQKNYYSKTEYIEFPTDFYITNESPEEIYSYDENWHSFSDNLKESFCLYYKPINVENVFGKCNDSQKCILIKQHPNFYPSHFNWDYFSEKVKKCFLLNSGTYPAYFDFFRLSNTELKLLFTKNNNFKISYENIYNLSQSQKEVLKKELGYLKWKIINIKAFFKK